MPRSSSSWPPISNALRPTRAAHEGGSTPGTSSAVPSARQAMPAVQWPKPG